MSRDLPTITSGQLRTLWKRTEGKPWEPRDITSPHVQGLVASGWVKRVDGHFFFERLPNAMLVWTDPAKFAMRAWDATQSGITTPTPETTSDGEGGAL